GEGETVGAVGIQAQRLVAQRAPRRERPAEPRPEREPHPLRQVATDGDRGEESEGERAHDVDRERPPREDPVAPALDGPVDEIAQRRPHRGTQAHEDEGHQSPESCRYRWLTTSTSSSTARPSMVRSSSCSRKASMRSGVSMMTTATGRSSDRDSRRVVWIRELLPKPSMPRSTLAPASPA